MSTAYGHSVMQRLSAAGAVDVKFLLNPDFQSRLPSSVKAQANFLLGSYLDGYTTPHTPVGKSTLIPAFDNVPNEGWDG